ncbi:hypothetical protein CUJ87_11590 [Paraburkholderia caledonica]|nr:hypothetical protein CUJ87_11590 [Paraburkholderia caledonica]
MGLALIDEPELATGRRRAFALLLDCGFVAGLLRLAAALPLRYRRFMQIVALNGRFGQRWRVMRPPRHRHSGSSRTWCAGLIAGAGRPGANLAIYCTAALAASAVYRF